MAQQEYDFSQGSIAKNIMSLAVPMTAAQLINVLYSVVDRMYLGRLPGHLALTGLGLTIPIVSIIMGFANLCGTGGAPLCSICRGRGDQEEAERVMGNAFTLLLIFGGAVTALFLIFKRPILYLFGASDATYPYADAYMTVYLLGTVFVMIGLGMNPFINAQGFGRVGMMTVGLGAVVNIVLDPIFIFALDMGVAGAAVATVIGQIAGAAIGFVLLWRVRREFRVSFRGFRPSGAISAELLRVAAPATVMQSLSSFMSLGLNQLFTPWSQTAVFVLGVYFKIQSFVFMPIFGVSNGLIPIVSYNWGARAPGRITGAVRFSLLLSAGVGAAGAALLALAASPLLHYCFRAGADAIAMGGPALTMTALAFPVGAATIILSASFQALGRAGLSLLVSLLRQIVLLLPIAALFLALRPGLVWLSFLCAEVLACLAAAGLYLRLIRPRVRALAE